MKGEKSASGYHYTSAANSHAHVYLLPTVKEELAAIHKRLGNAPPPRLFDLGCGNGSVGAHLAHQGWGVTGVDPSLEGIAQARKATRISGSTWDQPMTIWQRSMAAFPSRSAWK